MDKVNQLASIVVEYELNKKITRLAKEAIDLEQKYIEAKAFVEEKHYFVCSKQHVSLYASRCLRPNCREQVCSECLSECDICKPVYCSNHQCQETHEELAGVVQQD